MNTHSSDLRKLLYIATLSVSITACTNNPSTQSSYNTGSVTSAPTAVGSVNDATSNPYAYDGSNTTNAATDSGTDTSAIDNSSIDISSTTDSYEAPDSNVYTYNDNNTQNNVAQHGYVVQLIASISQQKANNISNTFRSGGYNMIQNSVMRNGRTLHRVQVGPYSSKTDAQSALAQMRNQYRHNELVAAAFVNEII